MEGVFNIFTHEDITVLLIIIPTIFIVVGFGIIANITHRKHLRRLKKIKQGVFTIYDEREILWDDKKLNKYQQYQNK